MSCTARNSLCGPTDSGAFDQNTGHPMRLFGSLDTFRDRLRIGDVNACKKGSNRCSQFLARLLIQVKNSDFQAALGQQPRGCLPQA